MANEADIRPFRPVEMAWTIHWRKKLTCWHVEGANLVVIIVEAGPEGHDLDSVSRLPPPDDALAMMAVVRSVGEFRPSGEQIHADAEVIAQRERRIQLDFAAAPTVERADKRSANLRTGAPQAIVDDPAGRHERITLRRQAHLDARGVDQRVRESECRIVIETVDPDIACRGWRKAASISRAVNPDRFTPDAETERILGLGHRIVVAAVLRVGRPRGASQGSCKGKLAPQMALRHSVSPVRRLKLPTWLELPSRQRVLSSSSKWLAGSMFAVTDSTNDMKSQFCVA